MHCVADICLVPMATESPSVSQYVAVCQRVLEKSGLVFKMHGYGTGIEGEFRDVMHVIEEMHEAVHASGVLRIASAFLAHRAADIRVGTRVDKKGTLEQKVASVEAILAKDKDQPSSKQDAPKSIDLPEQSANPEAELQRKVSETAQFLASPAFETPGKDV
ncbi:hypothetical protein JCM8547_007781 [Rhodosporidiobolus lusitaniae]